MIEIFVVIALTKRIANRAREKGQSAGMFGFLLVACWIVGEFTGAFAGAIASAAGGGEPQMIVVYAGALMGAAAGAMLANGLLGLAKDNFSSSRLPSQTFEVPQDSALRLS